MDKINKLTLPTAIIIASLILGGFYFANQVIKNSKDLKIAQEKLEQRKEKLKQRKCEALSAGLMREEHSVIGVTYFDETLLGKVGCVVTYIMDTTINGQKIFKAELTDFSYSKLKLPAQ